MKSSIALVAFSVGALSSFGVVVPMPRTMTLDVGSIAAKDARIVCAKGKGLSPEGYRLTVTTNGVEIAAADDAGEFYARETLRQLLTDGRYPCCRIDDAPAYRWRGMMIDEARHFLGKDTVKRVIDLMAMHKLNVLHWHLTDDQGWRVELKRHPELVEFGAVRPESVRMGGWRKWEKGGPVFETDGMRYGPCFHSQADIREILAYAKARHVTVVPEIEFPGHVRALLAAYPRCSCVGEKLPRTPRVFWGIESDVLCVGNDEAVALAEDILDEVCDLFPDAPYIHIGGDECPRTRWEACPKCRARMAGEGLKDASALQSWLTTRLARHLEKKGRRAVGWDEVLAGDVPKTTVGMSWRSTAKDGAGTGYVSAAEAVARGYDMVVTPMRSCYLSLPSGAAHDPYFYYSPKMRLTLADAYTFDPARGIPPELRAHILGGQASVWGEFVWTRFDLEWKTWPRACAIAEALWTAPAERDFAAFRRRMEAHRARLLDAHVNCGPLD